MLQVQVNIEISEATGEMRLVINQLAREDASPAERDLGRAIEGLIIGVIAIQEGATITNHLPAWPEGEQSHGE